MELNDFVAMLRESYRLKQNCDFAYTYKYGELHILCSEFFQTIIEEQAAQCDVKITSIHTYPPTLNSVHKPETREN